MARNAESRSNYGLIGLAKFFGAYFQADWLEDARSIQEALTDYLESEPQDPEGATLLTEVEELLGASLPEAELARHIEQRWHPQSTAAETGTTYNEVLRSIRNLLRPNSSSRG